MFDKGFVEKFSVLYRDVNKYVGRGELIFCNRAPCSMVHLHLTHIRPYVGQKPALVG